MSDVHTVAPRQARLRGRRQPGAQRPRRHQHPHDIDLHLARVKTPVLEVLERDGAIDLIGAAALHTAVAAAVQAHRAAHPLS
jgi:hypothetical protein